MHGFITDPTAQAGLRLAEDLPEPEPAPHEVVVDVRAFGVNRGELFLLRQRAEGWRPGQDLAGVITHTAEDGTGPVAGTRVVGVADGGAWSHMAAGGVAVTYGTMAGPAELGLGDFRPAPLARVVGFFHHVPDETKGEDLAILAALVADGRLRPQLGLTRDWEHTREALDLLRDRQVRGKAVLTRGAAT